MRLVLASASPRRAELLSSAPASTSTSQPADVDETPHAGEAPRDYALRVARDKAAVSGVRRSRTPPFWRPTPSWSQARHLLGKPADAADAARMLRLLSGTTHVVQTAVVLRAASAGVRGRAPRRAVEFRRSAQTEIDWYVATGEPDGKAGAYAIQGRAARFIDLDRRVVVERGRAARGHRVPDAQAAGLT